MLLTLVKFVRFPARSRVCPEFFAGLDALPGACPIRPYSVSHHHQDRPIPQTPQRSRK